MKYVKWLITFFVFKMIMIVATIVLVVSALPA